MGVIQLDYVLPLRFDLEFLNRDNQHERPVILHHAVLGSLERFVGVLLEQYGVQLPGLLRPIQVVLASVSEAEDGAVQAVAGQLRKAGFRVKAFVGDARLGDKVKAAELEHPELIAVIGGREAANGAVAIRLAKGSRVVSVAEFLGEVAERCGKLG
jgi:threonyl-tRNA synthetase